MEINTVALCIPAYNAAFCIGRLLESALAQSVPFNEILVYDDDSSDNTAAIAGNYGVTVVRGDKNRGCAYGKNVLANIATSKWIHFHDADDDILPDFCEKVHQWADSQSQYEVLLLNFNYIDSSTGELLGQANHDIGELRYDPIAYTIKHQIVNFGLYNKQAFLQAGGFDLDPLVLYNEDDALHQRLAINGLRFDYLQDVTCINYRYNKSMSSLNRAACARANFHVIEKTSEKLNGTHTEELSLKLFNNITILASVKDWKYVKKAILLLKKLKPDFKVKGHGIFSLISNVDLFFSVWVRECLIRIFKPDLRKQWVSKD